MPSSTAAVSSPRRIRSLKTSPHKSAVAHRNRQHFEALLFLAHAQNHTEALLADSLVDPDLEVGPIHEQELEAAAFQRTLLPSVHLLAGPGHQPTDLLGVVTLAEVLGADPTDIPGAQAGQEALRDEGLEFRVLAPPIRKQHALERPLAISRHFQLGLSQPAEIQPAVAIAVAVVVLALCEWLVTPALQMLSHLRLQGAVDPGLGLLQEPTLQALAGFGVALFQFDGYPIHSGLSSYVSGCFRLATTQSTQNSQGEPLLLCIPFTHL